MSALVPEKVLCPHCQRENPAIEETCSACGRSLVLVIGPPASMLRQFRLGHLMLLVAAVAVGFGLMRVDVLMGFLLLVWLVLSLLRTMAIVETCKADGRPTDWFEVISALGISMSLTLLLAILLACFLVIVGLVLT